jgi:plastocyanin domain-containing protein
MKKTQTVESAGDRVEILVEGGYKPEKISIPYGKTTTLVFDRKDSSSCLEEVVLSDFKIRKFLALNEKTEIQITPDKKGEFDFSCGMGMYHGKLIVK